MKLVQSIQSRGYTAFVVHKSMNTTAASLIRSAKQSTSIFDIMGIDAPSSQSKKRKVDQSMSGPVTKKIKRGVRAPKKVSYIEFLKGILEDPESG